MVFEYTVGNGKLLVSTLNLPEDDAGARWLKARMIQYAAGEEFAPTPSLSISELDTLLVDTTIVLEENSNLAQNLNDITMKVK